MENNKYLGEEKISKLLFKFAVPCILSLIISSLYNIVDQIFIGNSDLGYLGNAATTVVFPITVVSMAFAWCFGDGAAAFLSLCQGRKDTKNVHKAIGNSILMTFIVGILFIIFGFIFGDKLLSLFGASDATFRLAKDYFTIILIAIPFYMCGGMLSDIIRADGSPTYSMICTIVGAVVNIILDPIFIFVFDLGIKGAAYATIIGQMFTFIIAILYLFKSKTFKLSKDSFKLEHKLFGNVVKLGISTFVTQMSIVVISLVCNIMLAKYGQMSKYGSDIPIAVIGISMKVFTIVISVVVGIILGAQPILGYNYGAKNYKRVKETFKNVLLVTVSVGVLATIIFQTCPEFVINLFGSESPLYMEFAVMTFRLFLMLILFTSIIKMTAIFFQAVGQPFKSAIISLVREIVCFVPLVIVLPNLFGIKGILYAPPIADTIAVIISIILIITFFRKLGKSNDKVVDAEVNIKDSNKGVIITIAREHGSQGKYIGELVAKKLDIPYYYKEMTAIVAKESGLDREYVSSLEDNKNVIYDLYLSNSPVNYAISAQEKVIKSIASHGSCVIVGRAADYVLAGNENLVRVFLYAPLEYRIKKVMEMYKDTKAKAKRNIEKSDKARANYYKVISSQEWGKAQNYDLCLDSSIGPNETAEIICQYVKNLKK